MEHCAQQMITAIVQKPWIFSCNSSSSNSNIVIPLPTTSTESKMYTITSEGKVPFVKLFFESSTEVAFTNMSFKCSAKFIELTKSSSSLNIPETLRGKQIDENIFQYDFDFSSSQVSSKTIALKFVRIHNPQSFKLSNIKAGLITKGTKKVPTYEYSNESSNVRNEKSVNTQRQQQQQPWQQQQMLIMAMQKQFIQSMDLLKHSIDKRFDELTKRVQALESRACSNESDVKESTL
jgi:hypothetical protein